MPDELIDIYDENNQPLDQQKMKSQAHQDGSWHRAAHIWLYNSQGQILLQLRNKDKLLFPDCWDISAAGHVSAGEEVVVSGVRELEEEIGLKVDKEDLEFFKIIKHQTILDHVKNSEFYYLYFLKFDGDIGDLKIQEEELQEIKFFSISEIREGLKNHREKYAPFDEYWEEILNEVEKRSKIKI